MRVRPRSMFLLFAFSACMAQSLPASAQAPSFLLQWSTFRSPTSLAVSGDNHVGIKTGGVGSRVFSLEGSGGVRVYRTDGSSPSSLEAPGDVIAVDAAGNLYSADDYYTVATNIARALWSGGELWRHLRLARSEAEPFAGGVAVDAAGNVYSLINEEYGGINYGGVQVFTSAGVLLREIGTFGSGHGLAVDADGSVYEGDEDHGHVVKLSAFGSLERQWGAFGTGPGQFGAGPGAIAVSPDGGVYVVDPGNHRVQEFTSAGAFICQFGSEGSGPGQFTRPAGVAVDGEGNVYVSDYDTNRIEKFGALPTPATLTSWGRIKAEYR